VRRNKQKELHPEVMALYPCYQDDAFWRGTVRKKNANAEGPISTQREASELKFLLENLELQRDAGHEAPWRNGNIYRRMT
jgi:hypothetical protein